MPEFADTADWAGRHGFLPVTLNRWGKGETVPSFDSMADLADELGRSFVEILLAAKVITADEAGGHPVQHTPKVTPEQAIQMSGLKPRTKDTLLYLLGQLEEKGNPELALEVKD